MEVEEHNNSFEELFTELQKYRVTEEMNIRNNLGDHLVGHVYVTLWRDEDAERAVTELSNLWVSGQTVHAKLSPITDFQGKCRWLYEMQESTIVASATSHACNPPPKTTAATL